MRRPAVAVLILSVWGWGGSAAGASPWSEKGIRYLPPALAVSHGRGEWPEYWAKGFGRAYEELLNNLRLPGGPFRTRYAEPAPAFQGQVYLWDTAFIAQVWKPWDVTTAQEITFAVLDHADQGRLRHVTSGRRRSELTQPPLLSWSAWELYKWSGDRDYLIRAYPVLRDYNRWLYANRRLPCGLFFWKHPDESGMDNSPRFTTAANRPVLKIENLAAVDFSSYMVVDNEFLAEMAAVLGRQEEAEVFREQARVLRGLINTMLYDQESGYYFDREMKEDRLLKVKTIASLLPLFAGVPETGRAEKLRDHVMNPAEFNTPFPLPAVARDDPSFEKDMWRGPVWINTAYLVILGLERYQFYEEAGELSFRIADGVYRNYRLTGGFWEFYDPEKDGISELHREGRRAGPADKPRPGFVGWTGLANNLVIEHLVGFRRHVPRSRLLPLLPAAVQGAIFKLSLNEQSLEVELGREPGGKIVGRFFSVGIFKPFVIEPGLPLEILY